LHYASAEEMKMKKLKAFEAVLEANFETEIVRTVRNCKARSN
jgi:hypothetical protein